jgi:hypothetical protein
MRKRRKRSRFTHFPRFDHCCSVQCPQDPIVEPVWDGKGGSISSPLTPLRASVARFILGSRDPVERLVRDAALSEKEAQLGRMFLDVAQIVELQLQKADGLPR